MLKKFNKTLAIIAVVAIIVLSSMTMVVSAATINNATSSNSTPDSWQMYIGYLQYYDSGVVYGLVNVVDNGITFRCDGYYDAGFSGFYAYGQISNPALRADYASGAVLDYVGDSGTDSFRRGWYDINGGGNVAYFVEAHNYTYGSSQYITGFAL